MAIFSNALFATYSVYARNASIVGPTLYLVSQKKQDTLVLPITSPHVD